MNSQNRIDKALSKATETKFLLIEAGAINKVAEIFKIQFPDKKAIIIADPTTYAIAGEKITKDLEKENLLGENTYILKDPNLYGDYIYVEELREHLKGKGLIIVAVGSGVINDICKRAASELETPYMVVATAASMDGYSSSGAALTNKGSKTTHPCEAPQVIVADLNIISKAPSLMTASGYVDLYAKVPAGADWILASELYDKNNPLEGIEPITDAWHTVQDGLAEALADPEGAKRGEHKAIQLLVEGLMLGGFAMQEMKEWGLGVSRPASGAEHLFSHIWEMEHHTFQGEMAKKFGIYPHKDKQSPSHGFKVGIGILATLAFYELLFQTPVENLDIEKAVENWPSLEQQNLEIEKLFKGSDILPTALKQTKSKYVSKEILREQLTKIKNNWPKIKERLQNQLISFEETVERFKQVGAPTKPEEIGLTKEDLKLCFYKAHKLRARYTILDFAYRAGYFEDWVEHLFTKGIFK